MCRACEDWADMTEAKRPELEGDHAVDCAHRDGKNCDCNWEGERLICSGCKQPIDPEVCWCGEYADDHNEGSGHSPVPMGCRCLMMSGPCCSRDHNGDGNCDIHSAPGILRIAHG